MLDDIFFIDYAEWEPRILAQYNELSDDQKKRWSDIYTRLGTRTMKPRAVGMQQLPKDDEAVRQEFINSVNREQLANEMFMFLYGHKPAPRRDELDERS